MSLWLEASHVHGRFQSSSRLLPSSSFDLQPSSVQMQKLLNSNRMMTPSSADRRRAFHLMISAMESIGHSHSLSLEWKNHSPQQRTNRQRQYADLALFFMLFLGWERVVWGIILHPFFMWKCTSAWSKMWPGFLNLWVSKSGFSATWPSNFTVPLAVFTPLWTLISCLPLFCLQLSRQVPLFLQFFSGICAAKKAERSCWKEQNRSHS